MSTCAKNSHQHLLDSAGERANSVRTLAHSASSVVTYWYEPKGVTTGHRSTQVTPNQTCKVNLSLSSNGKLKVCKFCFCILSFLYVPCILHLLECIYAFLFTSGASSVFSASLFGLSTFFPAAYTQAVLSGQVSYRLNTVIVFVLLISNRINHHMIK